MHKAAAERRLFADVTHVEAMAQHDAVFESSVFSIIVRAGKTNKRAVGKIAHGTGKPSTVWEAMDLLNQNAGKLQLTDATRCPRIQLVGKSQSCMVSKLRMIWKQVDYPHRYKLEHAQKASYQARAVSRNPGGG